MTPLEYLMLRLTIAWYEFTKEVKAATTTPPDGVDDPEWVGHLSDLAAPVRRERQTVEAGRIPHGPDYIDHARIHAAETRLARKLDAIVYEAMVELGMSPSEVLRLWANDLDIERMVCEAHAAGF